MNSLRSRILVVAARLAKHSGLMNFTREAVAHQADCSPANVSYHFGTMRELRDAVVEQALTWGHIEILAQARLVRHPALRGKLTAELKQQIAAHIAR